MPNLSLSPLFLFRVHVFKRKRTNLCASPSLPPRIIRYLRPSLSTRSIDVFDFPAQKRTMFDQNSNGGNLSIKLHAPFISTTQSKISFFRSPPLSTVWHEIPFSRGAGVLPFSWDLGEKRFFDLDFRYTLHKHQKGQTTTTFEENLTAEPESQHAQIYRFWSMFWFPQTGDAQNPAFCWFFYWFFKTTSGQDSPPSINS